MKKIIVSFLALFAFFICSCWQETEDETLPTPSHCTVTLYANGGTMTNGDTGSTEKKSYTVSYEKKENLPSQSDLGLSRENFHFVGWAESSSASEYTYQDEAYITFTADLTLYAVWEETGAKTFYISETGNDETGTGTDENPYQTLAKAIENADSSLVDYIFVISDDIQSKTISLTDTSSLHSSLSAHSITIKGSTDADSNSISATDSSIFVVSTTQIPITIENITLKNGKGSQFSDTSSAKVGGGAIRVTSAGVEVVMNNVVFEENSASYGGALFNSGTVTLKNCSFTNNSSDEAGGAIYNEGTMTMTNCYVSSNSSSKGGGIYNKKTLSMTDVTISENRAESGGAVYNVKTGNVSMLSNSSSVSQNSAEKNGAGIYNEGIFTAKEGEITKNTLVQSDEGQGAGIYNEGTVYLSGANVKNHTAQQGGAVYNTSSGEITLSGGTISENAAKNGGAFFNEGSLSVEGGTLTKNKATESGGAIYSTFGTTSKFTISGGTISLNTAKNGGGVALIGLNAESEATAKFSNGKITNNEAENGGGVYLENVTLSLVENATNSGYPQISENTASVYGGGVYLKSGNLIVTVGIVSAYGKRKNSSANSSTYYSGNKAGENSGTSTEGMYAECGNSWFSEDGVVKKSGETLVGTEITVGEKTCHYSDEDLVVGVDGWSAIVE